MASGPKNTTSTTKSEPWAGAHGPLLELYGSAQQAYKETNRNPYTGQMYAGPNQIQAGAAADLAQNKFAQGSEAIRGLSGQIAGMAGNIGNMPTYSNPGNTSAAVSALGNRVQGLGDSVANRSGTLDQRAANVADASNPLLSSAADVERIAKELGSGKWLSAEQNPYLQGAVDAASRNITDKYQRQIAPAMNDAAIAAGAYGGSRNGVAAAQAAADTQQNLSDTIMGLYGQNYQLERDRMMQTGNIYNQAGSLRQTYGNMQEQSGRLTSAASANDAMAGGLYGQGAQLQLAANDNDRANYTTYQDSVLKALAGMSSGAQTSAGLNQQANQQDLTAIQGKATAGQQVQAWDQALLDDAFTRYQMQQQAPWAGVPELLSVLTGGGYQTTQSTQPNPNYRSPMQNIMGLASFGLGAVNPLQSLGFLGGRAA